MASTLVPVPRIGITTFGTRIGILVLVSPVSIVFALIYLKGYMVRLYNIVRLFALRKRIHLEICKNGSSESESIRQFFC